MDSTGARVRVSGKYFRAGEEKWYARGFCYGPFAPNSAGEFLPERERVDLDFAHIRRLGATCVRTYYPPPLWLLDTAARHELRVFVDVPWEKHRCFFEDWPAQQLARKVVAEAAQQLGGHPALFAISVANEIPNDIVRFYGPRQVQSFLDELLDSVHQHAPECLATYANYPTTEFLEPNKQDFYCYNVYLHDRTAFGQYLDRLQHLAGGSPLVIGEYGVDSLRHGEAEQAARLADFARTVFRHGAAGGFVFGYTDDWFSGGHQINDWAFGVSSVERREKRAARSLSREWRRVPTLAMEANLPKVSVVVCSYNGGATLTECLHSLMALNYPDYEVILVDDGSQDDTPDIAAQFPQVIYLRRENEGLSVARNVGLHAASGEVIAYTDSDCVADEHWLLYLVDAMRQQGVDGIGGPNLTPASDSWTAKCVAASPGNPSHVMFDDRLAEHLPGCNMAYQRKALLAIGGFDPQFRQAGDDVDICWRLLDRGYRLGYAAGAMVWHHRRNSLRAFYQQQKGYGRAEAMLAFKHPQRFLANGQPRFDGAIYGDGRAGLPLLPPKVYHGRFGSAPFQRIYQNSNFRFDARALSPEWHFLAGMFLLLSTMAAPLTLVSVAMWLSTAGALRASVRDRRFVADFTVWQRLVVIWLHLTQPIVRGFHRNGYTLRHKRLPDVLTVSSAPAANSQCLSASESELHWLTSNGAGRRELLEAIVERAKEDGWPGDFYGGWSTWDIQLMADLWNHVSIRTATEELGWPRRFTRARWATQATRLAWAATAAVGAWSAVAVVDRSTWGLCVGSALSASLLFLNVRSRRRCLRAVEKLIGLAANRCGLSDQESSSPRVHRENRQRVHARKAATSNSVSALTANGLHTAALELLPSSDPAPVIGD
jgi:GT2 family glycosyltransferase